MSKYWTAQVTLELSGILYDNDLTDAEARLVYIDECRAHGYMVDSSVTFEDAEDEEFKESKFPN